MDFQATCLVFLNLFALACPARAATDLTLVAKSSGRDVVEATLAKIQRSNIFTDDKRYLRRLAYVETKDGDSPTTYSGHLGGIWRVDEAWFLATKETSRPDMKNYHAAILRHFEIDWSRVEMPDLDTPLFSALAARLRMAVLQVNIAGELYGQAKYWQDHNGRGPADRFLAEADQLDKSEPDCQRRMDIALVLDGSGSIGMSDFQKAREFIVKLTSTLDLESARVAFVVYSGDASSIFGFDGYTNIEQMNRLIMGASYPDSSTNTAAGMTLGYRHLNSATSRNGASKVMMVFTDGNANTGADVATTSRLAVGYNITTIAVGIGSSIARDQLLTIAGQDSGRVFDMTSYQALLEAFKYFAGVVCSVPEKPAIDDVIQDKVSMKEKRFYEYMVRNEGVTVNINVSMGEITGYYSFSEPKPSSAIHDGVIKGKTYIKPPTDLAKLQNATLELFLAIEGLAVSSAYTLTTLVGNHVIEHIVAPSRNWVSISLFVGGFVVVIILVFALYSFIRWKSGSSSVINIFFSSK
ncbi:Collagen alpha-1(XII) chain [Halotydeus destructor]|nr:Collagen alpha-1(XII) chain [Halotydeus destructor]